VKTVSKVAYALSYDETVKIIRKGIGLIFPNSDTEIGLSGSNAVTQTNSEMSAQALGRVFFSL
jgi:hypothetical protein